MLFLVQNNDWLPFLKSSSRLVFVSPCVQVKLLEEKNTMYMQSTVSLEEDLRKANAAKGQLETYKRQVRLSEDILLVS